MEGREERKLNKKELLREKKKQWGEDEAEARRELELNPLSQYSTTQLKKELRRRKRNAR